MTRRDAMEVEFEEVTVSGRPALFAGAHIERSTVPDGCHLYELRHDDDGNRAAQIALSVWVNFWGSIITCGEIEMGKDGYLNIGPDAINYGCGECSGMEDFMQAHPRERSAAKNKGQEETTMKAAKKPRLYLAYGSNLNLSQMANRCPTAKVLGASSMKDWRLLFRGAHAGAVATVEPCKGASVPVLVWEITPADEAALDRYEGYPWLYRKETVKVRLGGKAISAMVYVMCDGMPLGQPGAWYYTTILDGYKGAGFDADVLRQATRDSAEQA